MRLPVRRRALPVPASPGYVERVDGTGSEEGVMNGCDLWVTLAVTIVKNVLALLDMAKASRCQRLCR